MNANELRTKLNDALNNIANRGFSALNNNMWDTGLLTQVYVLMFGETPHLVGIDQDGSYLNPEAEPLQETYDIEPETYVEEEDEDHIYTFKNVNKQYTFIEIIKQFGDQVFCVRRDDYPVVFGDHFIFYYSYNDRDIYCLQDSEYLRDDIKKCIVDEGSINLDERWFTFVTNSGTGFNETSLKVKKQDIDLESNYNDDLPHNKIVDFLKSTQSGLVLLYGAPGTGKTTYIRYLMHYLKGRNFLVLDQSTFNYITDASFVDLLLSNRNSVIILEDCEDMLADRISGNAQLATLLNLSDGIIGDNFNFKFICTFNANISKLDKAILRKGRLKQKYEFKSLTAEKTQNLAKKIGVEIPEGKSLTLTEIFNYNESNGSEKEEKKIGFQK